MTPGDGRPFVVAGLDRFRLPATSCEQILSPGGAALRPGNDPTTENDDLEVVFDVPVAAVGFDVLFQDVDGRSYTRVSVFDGENLLLYEGEIRQPSHLVERSPRAGSCFVGFCAETSVIKRILVDDLDDNDDRPDANIGFDSFRYFHYDLEPCGRWAFEAGRRSSAGK